MSGGLGTLSVLFTDVVGSTALRSRIGDDRADRLRVDHDAVVREAIVAHRGTVVKGLGDGLMATFTAAADAVAAAVAVAVQQAIDAHGRRAAPDEALSVRVGVSVGDVADVVRLLARGRGGFTFEAIGAVDLKGLPEPVPASRVRWEPAAPPGAVIPLPSVLDVPTATRYIGRSELLVELLAALADARAGTHRAAFLAGEPGVGKTRLASEVSRQAHEQDTPVLYGRCDDGMGVPYQPFVEALEHPTSTATGRGVELVAGRGRHQVPHLGDGQAGQGAPAGPGQPLGLGDHVEQEGRSPTSAACAPGAGATGRPPSASWRWWPRRPPRGARTVSPTTPAG